MAKWWGWFKKREIVEAAKARARQGGFSQEEKDEYTKIIEDGMTFEDYKIKALGLAEKHLKTSPEKAKTL